MAFMARQTLGLPAHQLSCHLLNNSRSYLTLSMKFTLTRVFVLTALVLQGCVGTQQTLVQLPPTGEHTQLKVSLFPYLPDVARDKFKSMMQRIEQEFEHSNPDVDLVLRAMDDASNPYDLKAIQSRFTATDPNASDVIEIDTVMLGEVVKAGLIQPFPATEESSDWLSAARAASHFNGTLYGLPHWLCGHFIISRDPAVLTVHSASDLTKFLGPNLGNVEPLSGNLLGSWNLPCLYLDAWADAHGPGGLGSAISPTLDKSVTASLAAVASEETMDGANPGLNGKYDAAPDLAAINFAQGKAKALIGYSERLNVVLKNRTDATPLHITSACLGEGNHPLAFTDVLVIRKDASPALVGAAARFAKYLTAVPTYTWMHNSEDAPVGQRTPRYLSPATRSAYRNSPMKNDPLVQEIYAVMKRADIFPQTGLLETRKAMRDAILEAIKKP